MGTADSLSDTLDGCCDIAKLLRIDPQASLIFDPVNQNFVCNSERVKIFEVWA